MPSQPLIDPMSDLIHARRVVLRYAILTAAIFVPLITAMVTDTNFYPVKTFSLFSHAPTISEGRVYYVLTGETVDGREFELPPIRLTRALTNRIYFMADAVANNAPFELASPHPSDAALMTAAGGLKHLPPGARMPDVLRGWGQTYNRRYPPPSPERLKALRLDQYKWAGEHYGDYAVPTSLSWRVEL